MTDQLERELRLLFAEDSEQAPAAAALADEARRRARQRRQSRLAWGSWGLVAASVAVVAGLGGYPLTGPPAREQAVTHSPESRLPGALPMRDGDSCPFGYSLPALSDRTFAFDGTVTSIGPARSDRPGAPIDHAGVTFAVNEWFDGGSGPTVTVDMPSPFSHLPPGADGPAAYDIGTRLLVSGDHQRGSATMAGAVARSCGFTRYYDRSTADGWRADRPRVPWPPAPRSIPARTGTPR